MAKTVKQQKVSRMHEFPQTQNTQHYFLCIFMAVIFMFTNTANYNRGRKRVGEMANVEELNIG